MLRHVPLRAPERTALPAVFTRVQGYLNQTDPDLRIRRSVEAPGWYVLERKCRRSPAVNAGMRGTCDRAVQARDGYIHVSLVHPEWLTKPWNIIMALREQGEDLWVQGAAKFDDELRYEEDWLRETRRRRNFVENKAIAAEAFDILNRLGNSDGTDVSRFNNPGMPA